MKKLSSIVLLFFVFNNGIKAQSLDEYKSLKTQYSEDYVVHVKIKKSYTLELESNEIKTYLDESSESLILNDIVSKSSAQEVFYDNQKKILDLSAWSYYLDNGRYKKEKVKEFKNKNDMDSKVFHTDTKYKTFSYPHIKEGTYIFLDEKYELVRPQLMEGVYLASSVPTLEYTIELKTDNNISVSPQLYHIDSLNYTEEKVVEKNTTKYIWNFKNIGRNKSESVSPDPLYYTPHIKFRVNNYIDDKGKKVNVLETADDLYNFNKNFISKLDTIHDPTLKRTIDSLVSGETDELTKAKKLYYWVKKNIKYIAFEYGEEGFIPRDANDIYTKKYGDCKDMANLIHKMFSYANIDSIYLAWIGTDKIPYSINSNPSPSVFNHMIAVWIHNGQNYFLDATNKNVSINYPSEFIQNKEAMLSVDDNNYKIVKAEEVEPEDNLIKNTINISIDGDVIKGRGYSVLKNYSKDDYLMRYSGLSQNEKLKALRQYLQLGNNNFILNDFKEFNEDNIDSPLVIEYNFEIPKKVIDLKDETIVNLFLDEIDILDVKQSDRKLGAKIDYKYMVETDINLDLSENQKVNKLPENQKLEENKYSFSSQWKNTDNKLSLKYNYKYNFIMLPHDEINRYKNFVTKVEKATKESIAIKNKTL